MDTLVQMTGRCLQSLYHKDTRRLVYSARVLLPRDMVLFGKWYSVRDVYFQGRLIECKI